MSSREESVKKLEAVSRTFFENTSVNFRNFRINKTDSLLVFNYSSGNSSTSKFQVPKTLTNTSIKNTGVILQKSNSKQKLQGRTGVVDTTFENIQYSLFDLVSQPTAGTKICIWKGIGCSMSTDIIRGANGQWRNSYYT